MCASSTASWSNSRPSATAALMSFSASGHRMLTTSGICFMTHSSLGSMLSHIMRDLATTRSRMQVGLMKSRLKVVSGSTSMSATVLSFVFRNMRVRASVAAGLVTSRLTRLPSSTTCERPWLGAESSLGNLGRC